MQEGSCKCLKGPGTMGLVLAACCLLGEATSVAGQLLDGDAGFEVSPADGTFPDGGNWNSWTAGGTAGTVCTDTAAHGGANGCWGPYTGNAGTDWWAAVYQEVNVSAGTFYRGRAYIRSPNGEPWANGSCATVRLLFLNAAGIALNVSESLGVTAANTDWAEYQVTALAPAGATLVRFICHTRKPKGDTGVTVANFDDCVLEAADPPPALDVWEESIGIRTESTTATINVRNVGGGSLSWSASSNRSWLAAATDAQTVTLTADKSGLGVGTHTATVTIQSNGGNANVAVYVSVGPYAVPAQPSQVTINNAQMILKKRMPDGTLASPRPFPVKGFAWSPASRGTPDSAAPRRLEFLKWYVADLQIMKAMHVNTVYTYYDFGDAAASKEILDYCYANEIYVIMTADENGTNNTNTIDQVVRRCQNHPAILGFAVGQEWGINLCQKKFATLQAAADATQLAARQIKDISTNFPVFSVFGDINETTTPPTSQIVQSICPDVDVWGLNVYRGASFGTLFSQWQAITSKPMVITEFNTDSFFTEPLDPGALVLGHEDEQMQADFFPGLWSEIRANMSFDNPAKCCLGGTVFSFQDEWFKVLPEHGGTVDSQEIGGKYTTWNPGAAPDSFLNEEFWGCFRISRRAKLVAQNVANAFSSINEAPTAISLSSNSIMENQPINTVVGTLLSTDPDNSDTFTYVLVAGIGDTDNGVFSITGASLKAGGVFDYETEDSYSIRVRTTDSGGLWIEQAFTITVTNVNEGPTDMALSASAVPENSRANTVVGTLSTIDADAGDTFSYILAGGADDASFNISGGQLRTSAVLNFEGKSSYSIRVRTTDSGGMWFEKGFTITVTNVNEVPTVTAPESPMSGYASQPVGFSAQATDPDGDALSYSWEFGDGGTSNKQIPSHTYTASGTYTARVTVSDGKGGTATAEVVVVVEECEPLSVSSVKGKLALDGRTDRDIVRLTGSFQIVEDTNLANTAVELDFGGVVANGSMDAKGKGRVGQRNFRLSLRTAWKTVVENGEELVLTAGGLVTFKAKLRGGPWADALADDGCTQDSTERPVTIPLRMTIGDEVYWGTVHATWNVTPGKKGSLK